MILASTGQVIDGDLDDGNVRVTVSAPFRPRYLYACTKVFLDMVGQVYAVNHGMNVIAVRLGWCPRDLGQVAQLRASAEDQDRHLLHDLAPAKVLTGFAPQDHLAHRVGEVLNGRRSLAVTAPACTG